MSGNIMFPGQNVAGHNVPKRGQFYLWKHCVQEHFVLIHFVRHSFSRVLDTRTHSIVGTKIFALSLYASRHFSYARAAARISLHIAALGLETLDKAAPF